MIKLFKRRRLRSVLLSICAFGIVFVSYQIIFVWKMTEYFSDDVPNIRVNMGESAIAKVVRVMPDNRLFVCDSTRILSWDSVNDDYCDCDDSTDETLTSACPQGSFTCSNSGEKVPSNRVNDGICDCCDGSDEQPYFTSIQTVLKMNGVKPVACPNRCK